MEKKLPFAKVFQQYKMDQEMTRTLASTKPKPFLPFLDNAMTTINQKQHAFEHHNEPLSFSPQHSLLNNFYSISHCRSSPPPFLSRALAPSEILKLNVPLRLSSLCVAKVRGVEL